MGFIEYTSLESKTLEAPIFKNMSPLRKVQAFLLSLTNACKDGRVLVQKTSTPTTHSETTSSDPFLKFLLLNPAVHFKEIVQEARSVILAGGTMSPVRIFKRVKI